MTVVLTNIKSLEDLIPLSEFSSHAIDIVREHMTMDGGHNEAHLVRVARNALLLGEGQGNQDILILAAILHDLVNIPKNSDQRNKASWWSARLAVDELSKRSVPEDILSGVHHAIHAHSFSAQIEPETFEAKVIQDADRLEALGAVGIARLFSVCGAIGRSICHPTDPLAENRDLDETTWGLDHFATKLSKLHLQMKTDLGKRLAYDSTLDMMEFIRQMVNQLEDSTLNSHEVVRKISWNRILKFSGWNTELVSYK